MLSLPFSATKRLEEPHVTSRVAVSLFAFP